MSISSSELSAATGIIRQCQRILVVPHANVDPDGLSSALACYHLFQAIGKECTVICPDTLPESMSFLPGFHHFSQTIDSNQHFVITVNLQEGVEIDSLRYTVEDQRVNIIVIPRRGRLNRQHVSFADGRPRYDLIVVVDSADLSLLGSVYTDHVDLFSQVPVLNIDHHISNTQFGQMQMIDPVAASTTEVLYQWFMQVPEFSAALTSDIATLLLTGLITDTRSFQNPNTTPRSLEIAAELLDRGAKQQEIIRHIYKTKPLRTLQVWGRALSHIQLDSEARLAWSLVSRDDLMEFSADSRETHGILDELISTLPDADVHVLFTELEEGGLKASVRSTAAVNVSEMAATLFQGGGHPRAAGFRMKQTDNFSLQVFECIRRIKQYLIALRRPLSQVTPAPLMTPSSGKTTGILPQLPPLPPPIHQQMSAPRPAVQSNDIVADLTAGVVAAPAAETMQARSVTDHHVTASETVTPPVIPDDWPRI